MCDGITDVMTNEQVVFELNYNYTLDTKSPLANARAACGSLVQAAYKGGSSDNLTVVFVALDWASANAAEEGAKQAGATDKSCHPPAVQPAASRSEDSSVATVTDGQLQKRPAKPSDEEREAKKAAL